MPRVQTVQKARKAIPSAGIAVGDKYYWWKFRFGGKHASKTYPKPSQLTQSSFYTAVYGLQERLGTEQPATKDDFESLRDEVAQEIEAIRDECQEKLDNMPEQLQAGDTGQLLQERIDAMESWQGEVEAVDYDGPDEEELTKDKLDENPAEEGEDAQSHEDRINALVAEDVQDAVNEAMERLRETDPGV